MSTCFLPVCELSPLSFWLWQDEQLRALVKQFGQQDWKFLASHFPVSAASPRPFAQDSGPGTDFLSRRRKGSSSPSPPRSPNKMIL